MSLVPSTIAEWLKSGALYASADNGAVRAAWGDIAVESEIASCLALAADAAIEGDRQFAFVAQPLARETVLVPGRRSDLVGTSQRLFCDRAGYAGGPTVFILTAQEQAGNVTQLTVLRRMTAAVQPVLTLLKTAYETPENADAAFVSARVGIFAESLQVAVTTYETPDDAPAEFVSAQIGNT